MERRPQGHESRLTASQSFNEDEMKVLDGIFVTLLRGGDPRMYMRHPAAKNVMRKVSAMKETIERQKSAIASEKRLRDALASIPRRDALGHDDDSGVNQ